MMLLLVLGVAAVMVGIGAIITLATMGGDD